MSYEAETAAVYDLFCYPDRGPEVDRWARLAGPPPARLLEPMVGTAEVALLLAARGYTVTGVDLSAPMLTAGEKRRQAAPPDVAERVTLVEGDICTVALPAGSFDLAFVGSGSWNLLTDRDLRVRALTAVRRSLKPGGRLVLDMFLPLKQTGRTEPRTFQALRPAPGGVSVFKTSFMERNAETQVAHIHETLSVDGHLSEHHLTLQVLLPGELEAECYAAGFAAVSVYGGEDLRPYAGDAELMWVMARA